MSVDIIDHHKSYFDSKLKLASGYWWCEEKNGLILKEYSGVYVE
jgi:hypothetical protein